MKNPRMFFRISFPLFSGTFCFVFLLFLSAFHIKAQSSRASDSLFRILKTAKENTIKVYILSNIAWEYFDSDNDSAIFYGLKTLELSKKINFKSGEAGSNSDLGVFYQNAGDLKTSLIYYNLALGLYNEQKNYAKQSVVYNNLARINEDLGNFQKAIDFHHNSISIREKLKDEAGLSQNLLNLGSLYYEIKNYKYAIATLNKALALKTKIKDKKGQSKVLNNLGLVSEANGDTAMAMALYYRSYKLKEELRDKKGMSSSLTNIGEIYLNRKKYDSALYFFNKSLTLKKEINNLASMPAVIINMAQIQLEKGEFYSSEKSFLEALKISEQVNSYKWRLLCYQGLSRFYSLKKQYLPAVKNLEKYVVLRDSIFTIESAKKIIDVTTKYETEKKENENILLKQQEKISNLQLKEQTLSLEKRKYLIITGIIIILSLCTGGYFYFSRQKIKSLQRQELAVRETEENERLRIAKDIHDDLGSGLSKIKFLSEVISAKGNQNPEINSSIKSISETSVSLVDNMRDLIWALNPENTTLDSLVARIREYSSDYLNDFPIELKIEADENFPETKITKEAHRNIFFILKECLQNIVKHANASVVKLKIKINEGNFQLKIIDNGKGIDELSKANGNGLRNIKQRAEIIGGIAEIISRPGNGFDIKIIVPLKIEKT